MKCKVCRRKANGKIQGAWYCPKHFLAYMRLLTEEYNEKRKESEYEPDPTFGN